MPVRSSALNGIQRRTLACTSLGKATCSHASWTSGLEAQACYSGSGGMTVKYVGCRLQPGGQRSRSLLYSAGVRDAQGACLHGLLLAACSVRLQRGPGNLCHRAAACSRHDADITRQLRATSAHAAHRVCMVTRLKTIAAPRAECLGHHINAQHLPFSWGALQELCTGQRLMHLAEQELGPDCFGK